MLRMLRWLIPIMLFLFVLLACGEDGKTDASDKENPYAGYTYYNHAPDVTYVGKETCKSCHENRHTTFVESEMGRSFKPAKQSLSAADWSAGTVVHDAHSNLSYLPFARGENLFVKEFRLSGNDTVYQRVEQIDYIVGSGQHTNSHMISVNGYVYQVPVTWYAQKGKWDLPPGFEGGHNTRFSRTIELECMTCHNAMPQFVAGSENKFMAVPHGIDCERCHGPGSLHVQEMQAGKVFNVDGKPDPTIVHPGKLPIELQFDICQRCHLQGVAVPKPGKTFSDFRPGMKLSDVMDVFIPRYKDSLNHFIMASHPDRLRMSACFKGTHQEGSVLQAMTCITCHDPHVSIETLAEDHYTTTCQSCHKTEHVDACPVSDENCVECHMPASGSVDIPHVSVTDHYIRVVKDEDAKPGSVDPEKKAAIWRLACRTQANPDPLTMARGYLAYYEQFDNQPAMLDSAGKALEQAIVMMDEKAVFIPRIRYLFLRGDYPQIMKLSASDAAMQCGDGWTLYRIGEAFQASGKLPEAISWMNKAVQAAPEHLRFRNELAVAYIASGNPDAALSLLNEVLSDQPKFAEALNNRGYAYVLKQQWDAAERDFKAALALDPDYTLALANMASLYLNTGRKPAAKPYVRRLLALEPDNEGFRQLAKAVE